MIKNYLKVAWRNLIRNKFFSLINTLGLALGMACSVLILLWVQNELDVDAFHKNGPQLFAVYERQYYDQKVIGQYATPGVLPAELKKQIPEIEYSTGLGFALLLSSPVAWYIMNKWLLNFNYHIDVSWWIFLLSGFIAIMISLATVSFQSLKAAMMNPIKSLRSE